MNLKTKRIIYISLIIINFIVIFMFSSQDSEESSKTSGVVVNRVVNTISNTNKKVKKEKLEDDVTFVVRKCAHFSIYTILGVLLSLFANTFNSQIKYKILGCLIVGFLYAISDEIHQSFVGGRSPEIRDVLIDTCGVLCGVAIVNLKKILSIKNEKLKTEE